MKQNVTLVCDLSFGSTGKGAIVGYIAKRLQPDAIVTAWMPNAGHTFIEEDGTTYVHTMLGNGVVSPRLKYVLIGPGSVINPESLAKEILVATERGLMTGVRVLIHPHAAVVTEQHREIEEKSMVGIGSTRKGCGAAIIQKVQRDPSNSCVAKDVMPDGTKYGATEPWSLWELTTITEYNRVVDEAEEILVEGAQGFSLSINQGMYPYTTSRDVTPMQILADVGISFHKVKKIIGTMRIHPIRVANRYNEEGGMVGWSGPGYFDQKEISWDELGVKPEKTTVTKLTRRVFTFSLEQARQAIRLCTPNEIFLNFVNYVTPEEAGEYVNIIDNLCLGVMDPRPKTALHGGCSSNRTVGVRYLGCGPKENHILDTFELLPGGAGQIKSVAGAIRSKLQEISKEK